MIWKHTYASKDQNFFYNRSYIRPHLMLVCCVCAGLNMDVKYPH